jgi:hypothetical protein
MPEHVAANKLALSLKNANYENFFTLEVKLGSRIQIHANLDTSSEEEEEEETANLNEVYCESKHFSPSLFYSPFPP